MVEKSREEEKLRQTQTDMVLVGVGKKGSLSKECSLPCKRYFKGEDKINVVLKSTYNVRKRFH